jgi:hypothetical protein
MLPNGLAGVEFHHEHRVLYKNLPVHQDHLYRCIDSGRLNRVVAVRAEFYRRQSVMSFIDRRELLAQADRWVKGGTSKVKESVIGGKACHRSHRFFLEGW